MTTHWNEPSMAIRAGGAAALLTAALCLATAGCERREKVLDIETPGADIEIDKVTEPDGGKKIEVDTERN